MNNETFKVQIQRLQTQWPNSYGEERLKRMWKLYEQLSNELFTEMVDEAIDTCRSAPLSEDFGKLEQVVQTRKAQQRYGSQLGSVGGVMHDAARSNKTADPELVNACMKLMNDLQTGKINKKQYFEGCDMIDQVAKRLSPTSSLVPSRLVTKQNPLPYKDD